MGVSACLDCAHTGAVAAAMPEIPRVRKKLRLEGVAKALSTNSGLSGSVTGLSVGSVMAAVLIGYSWDQLTGSVPLRS
ncbi:hypothetical protein D3C80_1869230 [compost metagenome]